MPSKVHYRKERFGDRLGLCLELAASFVYSLVCILIVLSVILFGDTGRNPWDYPVSLPMPITLAAALITLFGLIACLSYAFERKQTKSYRYFLGLALLSVVVLCLQLLVVRSIYFKNTWDPGTLMLYAEHAAWGADLGNYQWYFDLFPNNYFLVVVFEKICHLSYSIGFDPSFVAAAIGALMTNIAGYAIALTVYLTTESKRCSSIAWAIYTFLGGFSIWVSVPYSDTYLLPFVAGSLLCIAAASREASEIKRALCWLAASLLIFAGYLIKPTIAVFGIALAMYLLIRWLRKKESLKSLLAAFTALLMAAVFFLGVVSPWVKSELKVDPDEEKAVSFAHYLMMGANENDFGVFSYDDYAISRSIDDYDERKSENLKIYLQRVSDFGFVGYLDFLNKKMILTFCDGSFDAGGEGQDLPIDPEELKPNPYGALSQGIRDIYYADEGDSLLENARQIIWLLLLIGMIFAFLPRSVRSNAGHSVCFFAIAFVGVTCFLLLFETRARYLFCFLPLFCVLFSLGLTNLSSLLPLKGVLKDEESL